MESVIRKVRDIEADKRRWLETVVGRELQENQQVMIHVVDVGMERDEQARQRALAEAAEIARRGRAHAAAQGVAPDELDTAIGEPVGISIRKPHNAGSARHEHPGASCCVSGRPRWRSL